MAEPFSIKKALDLSPSALGKSWSIGLKIALLVFIIFTIYLAWIKPKQTQQQQITIGRGGQATIIQKQTSKRMLIPFVEVGVGKSSEFKLDTYIRAGLRFEF